MLTRPRTARPIKPVGASGIPQRNAEASADTVSILRGHVRSEIGPIATPDHIQLVPDLPKTRSGKIMRRILRKVAAGERDMTQLGDVTTLADPTVVDKIVEGAPNVE